MQAIRRRRNITPTKIGRAIVDALAGALIGMVASALAGALSGGIGLVALDIITILIRGGPSSNWLGFGFSAIAGAFTGLFAIPFGLIVGAVIGLVVGVRRLSGVIAVACGVGIGTSAGVAVMIVAIAAISIPRDGPFYYLWRIAAAFLSEDNGHFLIAGVGVAVAITAGILIGRRLSRQKTVI